ncbi:putative membrane protein [Naematelia encephala]|uniref:Putative membrane protein n=1 Tax=Naematelia encephala TaxID=71784 RepID=A0A1Y2B0K6_9TREE|nr:putative membrane protein [Naematelia encephala]
MDSDNTVADIDGGALDGDRPQVHPHGEATKEILQQFNEDETHLKVRKRDFGFLPIPKGRRYDPKLKPEEQFAFTWRMNLILATAATVSVANLYYIQPMLVAIATDFGVTNEDVSRIPTLVQGGYGCGIVLISPMGDLVRRRPLVLLLIVTTTCLSIGLALARNVAMLEAMSFVVGVFTVTPQICIPWTADLAPSKIRARSMSITLSGLIFGLVIGRVLAGTISKFASWRDTYWMAVGIQGVMAGVLYLALPDTPDKNIGLSYIGMLRSMVHFFFSYPTLTQACLMSFLTSAVFAGFWTTLTFLLSTDPYNYNSFQIGLWGLLGIIGALLAPQWGRLVDRIVPWTGQLMGTCISLIAMVVAVSAADISIGAVAVAIILYDMGQQLNQVSSGYRLAGIDPKARARINGCNLLFLFAGQTSGTAIMTKIYNTHGWRPTGGCAVAFVGTALLVLLARGPHETGWVGWHGGAQLFKKERLTDLSPHAITEGRRKKRKVGQDSVLEQGGAGDLNTMVVSSPGQGVVSPNASK